MPDPAKVEHDERQSAYFDERFQFFLEPIPDWIQKRTFDIVQSIGLTDRSCVLDIGCGVGALIAHFLEVGVKPTNIVGVDLSRQMLEHASRRFPQVYFWHGDVVDLPEDLKQLSLRQGPRQTDCPEHIERFDAVFFNACFGNIFNQKKALETVSRLLRSSGAIVISHPLGREFVQALNLNEPEIVPHLLPTQDMLAAWLHDLGLATERFTDEGDFYLAIGRVENPR
jgi:SAM-dependent methyltransferase